MQVTTDQFQALAKGNVRPLSYDFSVSFDKQFDDSVTFFILSSDDTAESLLDGPDVLAPTGANVITEWNKYDYTSYRDRIISLEWVYEFDFFYSITSAMADIKLNNYDGLFTRGVNSPLDSDLIPRRPVRLLAGFRNENIPQFVGLTGKAPQIDKASRTASLHAEDFLLYIFSRKLDRQVMYQNLRVDEILTNLFSAVGVLPDQMILDVARTTVPFAFFEKDQTVGSAVRDLMKAEMGSLYMDEQGFIVFKSRLRLTGDSVYTFNELNVIDYDNSDESQIVNSVSVKSEVRQVQPKEVIYELAGSLQINPGQTISKFFDLQDPATTADDIEFYTANSQEDGQGTDLTSFVNIVDQTLFATSILVEIENTGSSILFLNKLTVYGTPAKVTKTINVVRKDQDSIGNFEEQVLEIDSKYIQDEDTAVSIALTILEHFKTYGNTVTMTVKGNFSLQLGDKITIDLDGIQGDFIIRKLQNILQGGEFRQTITAQIYNIPDYFILSSDSEARSLLDSEDVLAA